MPEGQQGIQVSNAGALAGRTPTTVAELEACLLAQFPREDACEWDRMGVLVGNPAFAIEGVAIALDPTVAAVHAAKDAGANVLLTHHPVFLEAPGVFVPVGTAGHEASGAVVYEALTLGVACMNFHTALDFSAEGLAVLPEMLRLQTLHPFEPLQGAPEKGFGMMCAPKQEAPSLDLLAAQCVAVFGRMPRVWGNPEARIETIVTSGGSAGDLLSHCVASGIDCLICGEVKYHDALDAAQAGLCIIELGHDVSELPLCSVLYKAVQRAGIEEERITMLNQGNNWHTPESTRR